MSLNFRVSGFNVLVINKLSFDLSLDVFKKFRRALDEEWMGKDNFSTIFPGLVESIHVKLPDKTVEIMMTEVFGKDFALELMNVFDKELFAVGDPGYRR